MEKELYISSKPASGPISATRTEPFVKIIALVATLGGLLFGYDTGVVSGALLFMRGDLHLTPVNHRAGHQRPAVWCRLWRAGGRLSGRWPGQTPHHHCAGADLRL